MPASGQSPEPVPAALRTPRHCPRRGSPAKSGAGLAAGGAARGRGRAPAAARRAVDGVIAGRQCVSRRDDKGERTRRHEVTTVWVRLCLSSLVDVRARAGLRGRRVSAAA